MTRSVPSDSILVQNARRAVSAELKRKQILRKPIAKFDPKDGKVYLICANGEKKLVGEAMQRGRYSERCK